MSKPVESNRIMEKENTKEDQKKDGLTAVSESQAYAKNKPIVNNSSTAPTSGGSGTVPPTTLSKPIISSNSTPITSGISTPTNEGVFKIPKKITLTSTASGTNAILNLNNSGTLKLNKSAIGNLNQSLMAKQKIINKNEPLPKSHSSILDSIATSPRTASFPLSVSGTPAEEIRNPITSSSPTSLASGAAHAPITSIESTATTGSTTSTPAPTPSTIQSPSEEISEASTPRPPKSEKTKKLNNQVSTRTDFFAAKLASAVDDVDSSDSDETFVYENNAPAYDTQSISNHSIHEGSSTNNSNNNNNNNNNSTAAVGSPKLENKSNNGSMMNSPGVVAPAGMSLSSPPILDQSYEDTHNNTINSISTIQTELPPTETTTATSANNIKNNSNSANNTNNTQDDLLNDSKTAVSQGTEEAEVADVPESEINDGNVSNATNNDKKSHNNTTNSNTNPQFNATPTSNTKEPEHLHLQFSGYLDINSSSTSTPLTAGKTDSIQSLRSIKFPKANTNQNSKAPVNNNEPNVNTVTLNKEVTTISGKERPQTQRSNSIYSMTHPSLKGVTTTTITTNYNNTKNSNSNNGHIDEDVHGIQVSPNGSTILGTVNSNSFNDGQGGSGTGIALFDGRSSYQPSRAGTSINETYTNEDRYSSDDIDEDAEVIEDGVSTNGEFYGNEADSTLNGNIDAGIGSGTRISLSTMPQRPLVSGTVPNGGVEGNDNPLFEINHNNVSNSNFGGMSQGGTNSVVSKLGGEAGGRRNKSSTTSSKLRSTTSKLFDKKGSQPRRYSIIPDDIDIEDFDDELIYYDNNIRFPYSNNSIGNSAIGSNNQFNENSSLLDGGVGGIPGRIPHYRSLNLNPANNGGKKTSNYKNKRYLSGGQQFLSNNNSGSNTPPNELPNANAVNKDMFPFPYGEANQPYYYDFDEYDEVGSHSDSVDKNNFNKFGRKGSRNFSGYSGNGGHPQLSASNGHFFLPRKRSSSLKNPRESCVRSFLYTLISILAILSIGFIMGFILATTKELTHVSVLSIDNTLVSQDELVFNIVIEAYNPGWFSVEIQEVELDIFAKSGYLPDPDNGDNPGDGDGDDSNGDGAYSSNTVAVAGDINSEIRASAVETVLLGSILNLETPMYFRGGFVNRSPIKQVAEVKLVKPGSNLSTLFENNGNETEPEVPDNSKKWEIISKNPFDIIVRGLLKYKLPLTKNLRSVVVKKTSYVDPNDS